MGIKKLHSKLANISQGIKVNELRGARVGVEASGWLYQGKRFHLLLYFNAQIR